MKKQTILARIAPLLLAAALALAGIWLNWGSRPEKRAAPTDPNPRTGLCAHRLVGQIKPGVWQFLFHPAAEEPWLFFG